MTPCQAVDALKYLYAKGLSKKIKNSIPHSVFSFYQSALRNFLQTLYIYIYIYIYIYRCLRVAIVNTVRLVLNRKCIVGDIQRDRSTYRPTAFVAGTYINTLHLTLNKKRLKRKVSECVHHWTDFMGNILSATPKTQRSKISKPPPPPPPHYLHQKKVQEMKNSFELIEFHPAVLQESKFGEKI